MRKMDGKYDEEEVLLTFIAAQDGCTIVGTAM